VKSTTRTAAPVGAFAAVRLVAARLAVVDVDVAAEEVAASVGQVGSVAEIYLPQAAKRTS
jgi:hypothetical protein